MLHSISFVSKLLASIMLSMALVVLTSDAIASETSQTKTPSLLLISVDGLRAEYLTEADKHGLKIPFLRELMHEGAHATGVKGVLPSSTYPSHTTLITGVSPRRHGIGVNHPFDPAMASPNSWDWYTEDIRVPTLWSAAAGAGRTVASITWPVTVGARDITFNIPEYNGTRTPEDVKMIRALAPPGLMDELAKVAGPYLTDVNQALPRDVSHTKYAVEVIRRKHPDFMTVHLIATDHLQHSGGPFTRPVLMALEEIDGMIRDIAAAMREQNPAAMIAIVSDHGFSPVDRVLRLDQAFVKAGLITLKSDGDTLEKSGVEDWIAMPWDSGGSAAVFMKDPTDEAARRKVKTVLDDLTTDPANGIAAIFDKEEIAQLGGTADAVYWLDMKPGFGFSAALSGPLHGPMRHKGTHGYSPTHPEMNSVFVIAGGNVRRDLNLGIIDMRNIAPTLAKVLNVAFPSAELPPLAVMGGDGKNSESTK